MNRKHKHSTENRLDFIINIITVLIIIVAIIGLYILLKRGSVDISSYNKYPSLKFEDSGIFEKIKFIWGIIAAIITVVSLVISSIALLLTFQGGNINISTISRNFDFECEKKSINVNNKISIDLIQPKTEKIYSELSEEETVDFDWSDYNRFGNQKKLRYELPAFGLMDTAYLYIDNTGKFSENNAIIQFEADNICFDVNDDKELDYQNHQNYQNQNTIYKATNYNLELVNVLRRSSFKTLRIKVNPNGSLYPGLTERIILDDIFNEYIKWFYYGGFKNGKAKVPVKVTIAAEKYKAKTFNIRLNITEEEYVETEEY